MGKVYCLRCVKEVKLAMMGGEPVCSDCQSDKRHHYRGDERGLLVKVAQASKEQWKNLCMRQVRDANAQDYN